MEEVRNKLSRIYCH